MSDIETVHKVYVGIGSNIEPMGFDGPNFYNLAAFFETKNDLVSLKKLLNDIETQNGRSLGEVKFSSRTLDIDILYYDDIIDEEKNIPRSEIIKFDFVLRPLYDLAPGHIHPNTRKTHNKMLADDIYQKMIIKRISLPLAV